MKASTMLQRGFTLIELVMVIVLLGVLAVFFAPKLTTSEFNAKGFHDQTLSLLRYAQKAAIAQRRTVCVTLSATGVDLKIFASNPASGACSSAGTLTLPNTPKVGSGLSATMGGLAITNFTFSPLGVTDQASAITIAIANATNITVEAGTGYVHD